MDVLTIQWGWIGGYPTSVTPPTPTPTPSTFAGGGISYGEFLDRKRKKDDEEILILE